MSGAAFLRTVRPVLALAAALCLASPLLAQTSGRIEGVVTDETGAAVPGATVTATQTETNFARAETTDGEGAYSLTALPLGPFRVTVELSGFRPAAAELVLTVNQVARVDLKLAVGGQTEVVDVSAAAPLIDKSTSYIGTLIDSEQVENLPLNGRNFTQLATLAPGVNRGIPGSNASGGGGGTDAETFRYSEFGGVALSVNGLREQFNNYQIEGLDNNETLVNSIAYLPSPEVIQEFRVVTTNAPAEFGRAGGAVQNLVIKSGSNAIHGSAYYFVRPEGLAATPEFAEEKPEFDNHDFGATLGGPIVKDRTFYFLSYHGLRNSIPVEAGNRVTVPTQLMREGNFSELLDPSRSGLADPIIIYDPLTGIPFPGNVIPPDRINPVGRNYLNSFPMPDGTGVTRNYLTARQKESTYDDFDARLDHQFGASDNLFVGASYWDDQFSDPGRIPGFQAGFGAGTSRNKGYAVRLGETHTFSSDLINELRVGYTDFRFEFLPVGFGENQNEAIGIGGPGGINQDNGLSLVGGGNGFYIEYLGDFGQYRIKQRTIQLSDTVTWLRGSHTFKFGGALIRRNMAQERTQVGKGFYFFRDGLGFTPGYSGYEVADMLIGVTDFTATGNPGFIPRNVISWENSLFVQDDWRVNSKLTLNLGLRWDLYTPYYEEDDQLANFDNVTQRLVLPGQNGVPRSTIDTDYNNFGPRLGFNYLVDPRTALRASYGIFYSLDRGGIDRQLTENPPAVVTEYRFGGVPGSRVRLSDPIPLPTPVDPGSPDLPQGSGIVFIPRDTDTTMVQQWSVSVQRELTRNTAAMLAYVGTRAENLAALITSAGFAGAVADRLSSTFYIGESSYDSLQASIRRTQSHGLSYLASYTLASAENNTPGFFPGNPSRGTTVTDADCVQPGQTCNLDLDKGPADYDAKHRFTLAGTWDLPFAKDNAVLGGWALNAVLTLQSGTPFTVYSGFDGIRRADQSGDPNDGPQTVDEWFETSVFSPAAGSQGTSGRNAVRGPGIRTLDLSLFKTFKAGSRAGVELRLEAFNVFDSAVYSQPNNVVGDPNFGRITQTRLNTERQVQLAARLTF
ncbi:MAG TPA: TonB-dependent receptor [Vicinamibacteria bacterium]